MSVGNQSCTCHSLWKALWLWQLVSGTQLDTQILPPMLFLVTDLESRWQKKSKYGRGWKDVLILDGVPSIMPFQFLPGVCSISAVSSQ